MKKFMNDKPFGHISANGTEFKAERCDFAGGCTVLRRTGLSQELLLQDVAEMAAYHALHIRPDLNGFSGYDTIRFVIKGKK